MTTVPHIHESTSTAGAKGGDYRIEHFGVSLALQDTDFSKRSLRPGDRLPDAKLLDLNGDLVSLRDLAAEHPLVLVTGSVSCPMTTAALPDLNVLAARHAGQLSFALVQVREAHPGETVEQPGTTAEKLEHAQLMRDVGAVDWPVLVDDLDGTLHRQLDTLPNSLHVVAADGTILYRALFAGDARIEAALDSIASRGTLSHLETRRLFAPALTAVGFVHRTMARAGRRAQWELATAAPPMFLMAQAARLFGFLPAKRRGSALMLSLTVAAAVIASWVALT